jgi:C1A family cysteine protease
MSVDPHRFGWRRELPDHRDFRFSVRPRILRALPASADVSADQPPVYDQGNEGSCTGNAGSALAYAALRKVGVASPFIPSREGLYQQALIKENSWGWDAGAYLRDIMWAIANLGVWPEDRPGDPANQPYTEHGYDDVPSDASLAFGLDHQGLVYCAVEQSLCQLQGVLATGYPFMFGFTVYDSFEFIGNDGLMPMPGNDEGVLGGHAVVAVGYDNATRRFKVRNSWSADWGDHGYFYMPYEYALSPDLSDDFWTLQTIEEG